MQECQECGERHPDWSLDGEIIMESGRCIGCGGGEY